MLFPELLLWVRNAIDDTGTVKTASDGTEHTEYKYSDDRLSVLIILSMKKVFNDLGISEDVRPKMSLEPPYILDPPIWEFEIEDWFAELIVLKSACTMETGDMKRAWKYSGVTAKIGKAELRTSDGSYGRLNPEIYKMTSSCSEYNKKLDELKLWVIGRNSVVWRKFTPEILAESRHR